jgi:hypothetical protein
MVTEAALTALLLLAAAPPLPPAQRVEGERAVERARYAFVLNATKPFDEVYPRSVFEKKVRREAAEEKILSKEFGMGVTRELLAGEYDRIEKETRAPDQWEAVKKALGNDRRRVEEIVCRPLLVDRALRARFAFDQRIHSAEHEMAREAREYFLSGKTPSGARTLLLSRKGDAGAGTDQMLEKARGEAAGPKLLPPGEEPKAGENPIPVDPEMAKVLEKELGKKGDVTTILEERDRFSVFRLAAVDPSEWLVEAIQIPKRSFDSWLETKIGKSGR